MTSPRRLASPPWKVSIRAIDLNRGGASPGRGRPLHPLGAARHAGRTCASDGSSREGRDFALCRESAHAVSFSRRNLCHRRSRNLPPGVLRRHLLPQRHHVFHAAGPAGGGAPADGALAPGGYLFLGSRRDAARAVAGFSSRPHQRTRSTTAASWRTRPTRRSATSAGAARSGRAVAEPMPVPVVGDDWYEAIGSATRRVAALTTTPPAPRRVAPVPPPVAVPVAAQVEPRPAARAAPA